MEVHTEMRLDVRDGHKKKLARIISMSHEKPMDFANSLEWDIGVDRRLFPKKPKHGWLYGTRFHDQLTQEQQLECLWMEIARDVSMFISLEQTIPVLYMGYVNQYQGVLSSDIHEYLMIFSKEEIVHTLVFIRYLEEARLPMYAGEGSAQILLGELPKLPPALGILYTLIIEWMAELAVMESTQSDDIEPITKALFGNHHFDESRHIAFGRWISEFYIEQCSEKELVQIRDMVAGLLERMTPAYTFNPDIADYVSFEYPIDKNDASQVQLVCESQANQTLNKKRFKHVFEWLEKINLL